MVGKWLSPAAKAPPQQQGIANAFGPKPTLAGHPVRCVALTSPVAGSIDCPGAIDTGSGGTTLEVLSTG